MNSREFKVDVRTIPSITIEVACVGRRRMWTGLAVIRLAMRFATAVCGLQVKCSVVDADQAVMRS